MNFHLEICTSNNVKCVLYPYAEYVIDAFIVHNKENSDIWAS